MITLDGMNAEIKSALVFGVISFVAVFIVGLAASVGLLTVLVRIIIMVPLFSLIGYGVIAILRKYVPEIFEEIDLSSSENDEYVDIEESDKYNDDNVAESEDQNVLESTENGDFQETAEGEYPKYESGSDSSADAGLDSMLGTENGNLGKHVVVDQKKEDEFEKYEPSLIAQAVRTMMGKDE